MQKSCIPLNQTSTYSDFLNAHSTCSCTRPAVSENVESNKRPLGRLRRCPSPNRSGSGPFCMAWHEHDLHVEGKRYADLHLLPTTESEVGSPPSARMCGTTLHGGIVKPKPSRSFLIICQPNLIVIASNLIAMASNLIACQFPIHP